MPFQKLPSIINSLQDCISRRVWLNGQLPSVRMLAREYDTSAVTIVRALKELREQGKIVLSGNHRSYLVAGTNDPVTARRLQQRKQPSYVRIAELIRQEALTSSKPQDSLGPLHQFQKRFHCSHATVYAAMRVLATEGLVVQTGKRFLLQGAAARQGSSPRVHFTGQSMVVNLYNGHVLALLLSLERELASAGWGNLQLWFSPDPRKTNAPPDYQVSAFVHVTHSADTRWRRFFYLHPNIPLILIDPSERSYWGMPAHKLFCRIVPGNLRAGREVALHLADAGHRRVAFLTHQPMEYGWSQQRLRGVTQVFPPASDKQNRESVLFTGRLPSAVKPQDIVEMRANLENMRVIGRNCESIPRGVIDSDLESASRAIRLAEIATAMEPLFAQAFSDSSITGWICINDELAATAQEHVRKRRQTVNRRIAIASFDNSPLAYRLGITSYDFSFDLMGHLAAQLLLRTDKALPRGESCISIAGRLSVRQSTDC